MDGGAWWAAVAQSRTRLKQLSSSKPDLELHGSRPGILVHPRLLPWLPLGLTESAFPGVTVLQVTLYSRNKHLLVVAFLGEEPLVS